jgi:NTE family protein
MISRLTRTLLLLSFCLPAYFLNAQQNLPNAHGKRPSVGLVLSGGGAKGFAYIGLLRVIQEAGLPIDYIGGSSIGSIMGGLYALGYHPDTIEKMIRCQHWSDIIQDVTQRKYIAYEEKGIWENTILTLPLKNRKLAVTSVYPGQEINLLLNRFFSPAYNINDFSKLQIPFLCMGTNLFTGEAVILNKGYLPMAIRSSMSIPGLFAPVDYGGYYLVDGGVVNNYPVKEVKDMGASIIIGGDVQSGLLTTREQLASITAVLNQITSFARTRANVIGDSLANLKVPFKMTYGILEFSKYDSIIALGYRTARTHFKEIKHLADSLNAIEYRPMKKFNTLPRTSIHVDSIIIRGNKKIRESYFTSIFGKYQNSEVSLFELEKDIRLTYGSGYFEQVHYEFESAAGKSCLVINVTEGGPGELSAGVHYDSDYGIILTLGGTFRNVLGHNSKLFADVNVAMDPRVKATYLLGLGGKASLGAQAQFYFLTINIYDKDIRFNKLNLTNYKGSLFFNYNFRNTMNLRTGFEYEYFRFKQDIIIDTVTLYMEQFSGYGNAYLSLNADTRDRAYYPKRGIKAALKIEYVMPLSDKWSQNIFSNSAIISLRYDHSISITKRVVLQPGLFAGAVLNKSGTPPMQHMFGLGGLTTDNYIETFAPFTGLHFIQSFGYYSLVGRMKLQYNVYQKLYLDLRADIGANESESDELFASRNFLAGYGITASYNSFIGPLEFSVMSSNINPGLMVYLNLGYWF